MKKALVPSLLAISIALCAGCLPDDWDDGLFRKKTSQKSEYLDYLKDVRSQPLEFDVPDSEEAAAWTRAQFVIGKYHLELGGGSRLQVSADDIIEIAASEQNQPFYQEAGFLFRIVRTSRADVTHFVVSYGSPSRDYPGGSEDTSDNNKARAKIIAYFIATGRLYKETISFPELGRIK